MDITADKTAFSNDSRLDRVGIVASILCAIHCAVTPALLILLPTFGEAWAHPSTHWGMAILVIPIAIFMMRKGYLQHGRKWVMATGSVGIIFIIIGAILPYTNAGHSAPQAADTAPTQATCCVDQCCPSVQVSEQGEKSLHIPPASVVTTLGGICLIAVHVGNLCSCSCCNKRTQKNK